MIGWLTGWCLTDRFTRGIDSPGGESPNLGERVSPLPSRWLIAPRGQLKLAGCAVYKRDWDRDQELLTCQVLAGHTEDTQGDR